jgi:hypothetical protein
MVSKLFLIEMAFGENWNHTFFVFGGKRLSETVNIILAETALFRHCIRLI